MTTRVSPEALVELVNAGRVRRSRFVPPVLGQDSFGHFEVECWPSTMQVFDAVSRREITPQQAVDIMLESDRRAHEAACRWWMPRWLWRRLAPRPRQPFSGT